jgi:AAA domain
MTTETFDRTAALDAARATIKAASNEQDGRIKAMLELEANAPDLPAESAEQIITEAAASLGRRIVVTWANEYELRNVRWLWDKRVPLGMLSGLYGVEGMGKSMETARIAAGVTRGKLPGDLEGQPRRVLIATTEDGWQETVAPRLKAAGADMEMVGHVRIGDGDGDEGLELPRDAELLGEFAQTSDVALVVLDPVVSHLDGRAESHKTKDVRKALEPLHRAAETAGFAVLGIMHFNKEKGTDTRQRSQMSSAFREVFRSTLVFGPDPDAREDKSRRVVALDKNNLVTPQPSYRMKIESVTLEDADPESGDPIQTARIVIGEACSYTAEELLEAAAGAKPKALSDEADQARRFLLERVEAGDGATPVKATQTAADAAGISSTALDKARTTLKLGSRRVSGGTAYEWYSKAAAGEELEF